MTDSNQSVWFVVTQNPSNGKLVIIASADEDDAPAVFESESAAVAMAETQPLCRSWGYETYEWPR